MRPAVATVEESLGRGRRRGENRISRRGIGLSAMGMVDWVLIMWVNGLLGWVICGEWVGLEYIGLMCWASWKWVIRGLLD